MANNSIEIEIRFPLFNPEDVRNFLDNNANLQAENIYQKDTYFIPAHRDFLDVEYIYEWLRLRESDKGMSLNYKHFFPENVCKTDYCEEFETKVDNIDALKKMFNSLNFREAVVVEKNRAAWLLDQTEIVIDDVTDLGSFMELEATGHFDNPKEGKEYLYSVLQKMNAKVGEEDLRGYPYRILEKQGYKFK